MLILFFPLLSISQSDGAGNVEIVPPLEIHHSTFAETRGAYQYQQEELPKYKKGKPVRFLQWFDFKENDTLKRYRREYLKDYFINLTFFNR